MSLFNKGDLLLLSPFIFPDGGQPKDKFFIVLSNIDGNAIIATLPTSKDHVPSDVEVKSGCIDIASRNFNAFVFMANELVTQSFRFKVNTFVYGCNLHLYNVENLTNQIDSNLTSPKNLGHINKALFNALIECLQTSSEVKRKYKLRLSKM